nr:hypothetical protein [Rhodopirellula sp. SM50]
MALAKLFSLASTRFALTIQHAIDHSRACPVDTTLQLTFFT